MKNTELGRKIIDVMDCEPERFNMRFFVRPSEMCGTVACLAGHAMLLSGYTVEIVHYGTGTDSIEDYFFYRPDGTREPDEEKKARKLLGLTEKEYGGLSPKRLFYDYDDGPDRFRKIVEESEGQQ